MNRFLILFAALFWSSFALAAGKVDQGNGDATVIPWLVNCVAGCSGGGGGGGAITAAPGSFSAGALLDGADVTLGTKADAAWASGSGSLIAIAKTIAGNTGGAIPPGPNNIGSVINAPSSASANAVSHTQVTALAASLVVKASAGNLYSYNCTAITGGAAGYCVAVNATAAPATGTITGVLDVCYFATNASGCSLGHGTIPANYGTGIVILVTSAITPFTYTTGTDTAFISADYQ